MSTNIATLDQARHLAHPAAKTMPAGAVERGASPEAWHVMKTVLFKGASDEMICTLIDYCKARRLDPLKKPFHIVQVWDSAAGKMAESIWPSIGELRTTAMRTKEYAGKNEIEFGPERVERFGDKKDIEVAFPEWARCTVYRMIGGQRVEFAGSPVYWLETYASVKGGAPNAMWRKRPRGQLAKCAEAEALRSAFPEEVGNEPTAEEMEGQTVGPDHARDVTPSVNRAAERRAAMESLETVEVTDAYGAVANIMPGEVEAWARTQLDGATPEQVAELAENNPQVELFRVEAEKTKAAAPQPETIPLVDAAGRVAGNYNDPVNWLRGLDGLVRTMDQSDGADLCLANKAELLRIESRDDVGPKAKARARELRLWADELAPAEDAE